MIRLIISAVLVFLLSSCKQRTVDYAQVYSGENGPSEIGAQHFSTRSDLDNSWVKKSLSETNYQKLLKQTDFSKQMIVAVAAGERTTFSGKMTISYIYEYTGVKDLPLNLLVQTGVMNEKCRVEKVSFPFVLAIVDKPSGFKYIGGLDVQNFEDVCP